MADASSYPGWEQSLKRVAPDRAPLDDLALARDQATSTPGEDERAFRIRLGQVAREARDAQKDALTRAVPEEARRAREADGHRSKTAIDREEAQASQRKTDTLVRVGTTLLGAFLGRRSARSTLSQVGVTARSAGRMSKEASDVKRAEEKLDALQAEYADLDAQLQREMDDIDLEGGPETDDARDGRDQGQADRDARPRGRARVGAVRQGRRRPADAGVARAHRPPDRRPVTRRSSAGGGVVLGVSVGAALVLRRSEQRRANVFLGLFLIAGSVTLLNEVVSALELYRLNAHFYITPFLYTFALGPLIAGFVRSRVQPTWRLGWREAPHVFLPAWQLVHELTTGFAPLSFKAEFWQTPYARFYASVDTWLFIVSFAFYLIVAYRRARVSGTEERPWLVRLVTGCALILSVAVLMQLSRVFLGDQGERFDWLELGASVSYATLIYWTSLTGWLHTLPRTSARTLRKETYGIDAATLAQHAASLRAMVEREQPHLDSELTQPDLASRIGLTDKELSYVLNEGLGTSYADYINGLRVAEAQRRLLDSDLEGATVLEIAMTSGFASKATFNRVFKKATGVTPTTYRAGAGRLMVP